MRTEADIGIGSVLFSFMLEILELVLGSTVFDIIFLFLLYFVGFNPPTHRNYTFSMMKLLHTATHPLPNITSISHPQLIPAHSQFFSHCSGLPFQNPHRHFALLKRYR